VSGKLEGTIVSVGDTGNLISDIPVARLDGVPTDERTTVSCDEHQTIGLFPPEHDQPQMTLIALLGSSGFLELSLVGDSARSMLGVREGEKIVVQW
jgi:S-adenosylmethionine hydrolase